MQKNQKILLIAGIVFAGFCARSPITGIGPLLSMIGREYALNSTVLGLLTTIPLIVFALGSVTVVNIASRIGSGRMLPVSFLLLALGICLRSMAGLFGLYLGTAVIALGMTIIMVLIPAIVKSAFPDNPGSVSSLFTGANSILSSISAAVSIPLAAIPFLGWRGALVIWAVFALAGFGLWIRPSEAAAIRPVSGGFAKLLRSRIAWSVSIYNGMHSMLFYCMVAWLPTILQSRGFTAEGAGYCASLYQLVGIPLSFIIPAAAGRMKNQRPLALAVGSIYLVSMAGLLLLRNPVLITVSVALQGVASVSCFSVGMVLFIFRAAGVEESAALSGMAQTTGYVLAAFGPICLGRLYDVFGNWFAPGIFLIVMVAVLCYFLLASSGDEKISFDTGH